MDKYDLAKIMLEWEVLKRQADEIERRADKIGHKITLAVLALKETQSTGNVQATYRAGRKSYDYEGAVNRAGVDERTREEYTKIRKAVNWRMICKDSGIIAPFVKSDPVVSIKLLD